MDSINSAVPVDCGFVVVSNMVHGELGLDGPVQVACDAGDDGGKLDRAGDVVDEVDEHRQVEEQKDLGHGDREMRDEGAPG